MKQIYGIDLSKEKFDVCFIKENDTKESFLVVKNTFNGIVKFLEKLPDNALICCEHTGVYGDLLLFLCSQYNISISLVSGYEVRHSSGLKKEKTDMIDAKMLREYAIRFYDKIKECCYSNESMKELNDLYKLRSQLVKERKMLITHDQRNQHFPFNSIKANQITKTITDSLSEAIKELENEIMFIIHSNMELFKTYNTITTIKGIGQITACNLIIKTENFKGIDTARKAASYAGVCPFNNSSGKMQKKARVSNMADKELKTLLYLCTVVAVKQNPEFKFYYERKKLEGKPYFLIMNNLANKLLRITYSLVKTGNPYVIGHIVEDPRLAKKSA
jgi:transposase